MFAELNPSDKTTEMELVAGFGNTRNLCWKMKQPTIRWPQPKLKSGIALHNHIAPLGLHICLPDWVINCLIC